jgi:hypothetical protein
MRKRKIDKGRSKKRTRKKISNDEESRDKTDAEDENPSFVGFTQQEEEEPLAIHISCKQRRTIDNVASKGRNTNHIGLEKIGGDDKIDKAEDSNPMHVGENDEGSEDEEAGSGEEDDEEKTHKFEVRQKVLARDEDGILYPAYVRRKLCGVNHHKSISCLGIFDIAPEEIENEANFNEDNSLNGWYYFVHYEGWKTIWDRWVSESDIWDITPENLERMKEISGAHKALQLEFKGKTKKRKIQNGGLFLKEWKNRLDGLYHQWAENEDNNNKSSQPSNNVKKNSNSKAKSTKKRKPKKKKQVSPTEILQNRSQLAMQSCLTSRQSSHIQSIPLSFGLKRILVEDWENLNSTSRVEVVANSTSIIAVGGSSNDTLEGTRWDMVHILPAKVTIRNALGQYLKEKDISWDTIHNKQATSNNESISNGGTRITDDKRIDELIDQADPSKPEQPLLIQDSRNVMMPRSTKDLSIKIAKPTNVLEENLTCITNGTCTKVRVVSDEIVSNHTQKSPVSVDQGTQAGDTPSEMVTQESMAPGNFPNDTLSNYSLMQDPNSKEDKSIEATSQLTKEWTDMADGVALYFEQALMSRLLYPSEISQLLVLKDGSPKDNIPLQMIDVYGCEHLLRLLASLPSILDQQFQDNRKKKIERKKQKMSIHKEEEITQQVQPKSGYFKEEEHVDDNADSADQDAFAEVGSMIVAKLQDFARFLQKNQSTLFSSLYRKKNELEIKQDLKIQRRQERRLKILATTAASSPSVILQETDQAGGKTDRRY